MQLFKLIVKIVKWILFAFVAVVLVHNVYVIIRRTVYGDQLPSVFGFASAVVVSPSMEPTISVNDVVLIHARDEYHKDDIIAFYDPASGDYITHKIIEVTENGFRTQGENNDSPDPNLVKQENIVGAVYCVLPGAGYFSSFIATPLGAVLTAVVGAAIIFLPDAVSALVEKRRKKADE